ncbi:MAG: hypothetical protein LBR82_02685 [Desulfovibrio sp.]|jgi:hypothetical protein|nr:hypothetical protein [Desulfovibrio sp.]
MGVALLYVPDLRPESAPADVPGHIAFFPSGLPEGRALSVHGAGGRSPAGGKAPFAVSENSAAGRPARSAQAEAARRAVLAALPLSPPEAQAALEELLRIGLEYSPHGLLRTAELYGEDAAEDGQDAAERADLAHFAATGAPTRKDGALPAAGAADDAGQAQTTRRRLVDAQKILILAEYLEEKNQESAALEQSVRRAEQALRVSLGEGGETRLETAEQEPGNTTGKDFPRVDPQTLLRAVRHFLPEHVALFTADDELTAELTEEGLLGPLPVERAILAMSLPARERSGLLYARLPAAAFLRETELLARPGSGIRALRDKDAEHA